ncbi:hypothetical protein BASA81_013252 [Batrachochytrium salamandrivorans]|nr:hypothetical protein BASA81_013252 [Batrachochytrium salamandrivorans]
MTELRAQLLEECFTNALITKDTSMEEEKNFLMEQLNAVNQTKLQDIGLTGFQSLQKINGRGKEIAKRCNLQQFPDLYTVNPRTGRLAIRGVG